MFVVKWITATARASFWARSRALAFAAAAAVMADAKRPRIDPCDRVIFLNGDDSGIPDDDKKRWLEEVERLTAASSQFIDDDFPTAHVSIKGKETPDEPPPPPPVLQPGIAPKCKCGEDAASATVKRDTPNKGREYYHCKSRKCGFFCWADGGEVFQRGGSSEKLDWSRMPIALNIVSDFGFRAEDLRQGGVGDCWFMSALAVVAERHDLIAKIFGADTARNQAGLYCLRLFMDGKWASVWISDELPVTGKPRRETLAFDTKLAFCRCGSATGEQQLWASLVEKAYAKCHGSYQSISGGWVAEALLDLTGAPTEMIYLGDDHFDSELFWARLRACRALGLPMGCGTNNAEGSANLKEVGLVGGHAYSILDVREAITKTAETVRLLRVRNPHGCTEWSGDWSDDSEMWSQLVSSSQGGAGPSSSSSSLPMCPYGAGCYRQGNPQHAAEYRHHALPSDASGFERTGVDDGTFWIDYTKFLMGFSHVDVCYAFHNWHTSSFANHFPPDRKTARRVCASVLTLRHATSKPCTLMVMALQPTKRGAWCRLDRKKSYRLGDLSVLIGRLTADGTAIAELVGGGLRGADRGERTWIARLDQPNASYVVVPMCLSNNPTAAESTARQPFSVRLWSSEPLKVSQTASYPPTQAASVLQIDWCSHLALQALHLALVDDLQPPKPPPRAFGRTSELERLMQDPEHAALLMDNGAGGRIKRQLVDLSDTVAAVVARGSELTLVAAYNWGRPDAPTAHLRVTAYVKSSACRSVDGLLTNHKDLADAYYRKIEEEKERRKAAAAARGVPVWEERDRGPRWPAKWAAYRTTVSVQPGSRKLLMVVAASGMQAEIGAIDVEAVDPSTAGSSSSAAGSSSSKRDEDAKGSASAMARWLGGGKSGDGVEDLTGSPPPSSWSKGSSGEGIFAPAPFTRDEWLAAKAQFKRSHNGYRPLGGAGGSGSSPGGDDAALKAALEASAREQEEKALKDALAQSAQQQQRQPQPPSGPGADADLEAAIAASLSGPSARSEDEQMAMAMAASREEAERRAAAAQADEDAMLQQALAMSRQEVGGQQAMQQRGGSVNAPIEIVSDEEVVEDPEATDEDDDEVQIVEG